MREMEYMPLPGDDELIAQESQNKASDAFHLLVSAMGGTITVEHHASGTA